jgi:N-acetylmuramoyl-L-alanine amidase
MKIIVLNRKIIILLLFLFAFLIMLLMLMEFTKNKDKHAFNDPGNRVIVIDAGHGGIDGGTKSGNLLEKEINLDIAKRLKETLELRGYNIILTREEDKSLDQLSKISANRHLKDLNARLCIINTSSAQMFLSIHVNYHIKNTNASGAIVFFNEKYAESSTLAHCIQNTMNKIEFNNKKQTIHNPVNAKYYLLDHSNMPGVIIETAFLSNESDRINLRNGEFLELLAWAIADGIDRYMDSIKISKSQIALIP